MNSFTYYLNLRTNHRLLKINHLIILFVTFCLLPSCYSDCSLVSHEGEQKEKALLNVISPLKGRTFVTKDVVEPDHYTYKVSICSPIEGQNKSIGAVQYVSSNESHSLGRYDMTDVMGGTDWILLTYYGGVSYHTHCNKSERITKIMITCDPETLVGTFEILEERRSSASNCYYLFELSSSVACNQIHEKAHLSSGSVFCIIFFTIALVYLVCGFLYKRIVIGAQGLEQIPNYSFWRDFGNLQADGCDFFCRCGPRRESQAYRGIDDPLKTDEERDDQLLNM